MSITWNGVSSDTIGVIVEKIPNRYVPTRRFSPQQVAGRNGNILLVDKAFPNVEQEYEVYLSAESHGLPSVARACSEWLMGPDGYCRLTDSYDTTVYREAFLMGGFDIENILNKFGRCTITFSCKPQKYLLTGDTPIEIPAGITTYTGDVVQFDGVTGASITSMSTTITPTQDLHGYSSPWPAGGGKNKLENLQTTQTISGVTFTVNPDGSVVVNGTASALIVFRLNDALVDYLVNGAKYILNGSPINTDTTKWKLRVFNSTDNKDTGSGILFTFYSAYSPATCDIIVYQGTTMNNVLIKPMIRLASVSDDTFSPYSNICPISGRTGLNVYRTGKNLLENTLTTRTSYGTTFTVNANKSITVSNTPTQQARVPIKTGLVWDGRADAKFSFGTMPTGTRVFARRIRNGVQDYPTVSPDFTVLAGDKFYDLYLETTTSYDGTEFTVYPQIELGSTATTYEPYQGTTYAIDWTSEAGTVYGGTLDVVTGVLTVDRANIASYNGEVINEPWLSSMDAYAVGTTPTTGAQVVYTLATPLTYQLTAQEVEALVGTNNVWSSSGDVSVTVATPLGGTVTNPTPFEARPLLTVSGVGEITINGKSIQILESVSDFEIDCETMEAEDNSKIYCMDFPELSGGENEIVGYGSITALTVTPRWWTL